MGDIFILTDSKKALFLIYILHLLYDINYFFKNVYLIMHLSYGIRYVLIDRRGSGKK